MPEERVQCLHYREYNPFCDFGTGSQLPAFLPRIAASSVASRLATHGGVLVTGAKATGKTTLARKFAASEVRLDQDRAALAAARVDPALVLDGPAPRLIDEYQLVEGLWEAVRGRIDDAQTKGLFLLTGSSTPDDAIVLHTGARRIAPIRLGTMTFYERGLSSGALALGSLLESHPLGVVTDRISVTEAVDAIVIGGWPTNVGLSTSQALEANIDYLDMIVNADVRSVDGVQRDPDGVRRVIASYARNVATDCSLRAIGRAAEEPLAEPTLHDYVRALRRLFLIDDQDAWAPRLRSRIRLAATPKRHLVDPSLAVAAVGATTKRLLGPEIELTGFLFESQVTHDLRVYGLPHRATVRFYRDNKGLEVDAILETPDGLWLGFEMKLGASRIDEGASNLLAMRGKLTADAQERCRGLIVVVADSPTYRRPDGVIVTSIAAIGP